jgi:hypothetical protein
MRSFAFLLAVLLVICANTCGADSLGPALLLGGSLASGDRVR